MSSHSDAMWNQGSRTTKETHLDSNVLQPEVTVTTSASSPLARSGLMVPIYTQRTPGNVPVLCVQEEKNEMGLDEVSSLPEPV